MNQLEFEEECDKVVAKLEDLIKDTKKMKEGIKIAGQRYRVKSVRINEDMKKLRQISLDLFVRHKEGYDKNDHI